MAVTTNTRKLAALLGASGAGIGTDGLLQSAGIDTDMATQAELDAAAYSDVGVRQDILTLALKEGVQENSTKFNLTNSSICATKLFVVIPKLIPNNSNHYKSHTTPQGF